MLASACQLTHFSKSFSGDALFGLARFKSHPTGVGVGFWPNW